MVKQAIKRAALALLMCAFAVCLALGISLLVPQAQSAYAEETDPNVHTTHDSSWQRLSSGYSSGRYYLGGDHDRDMVINGDVTLCLNGHILRGTGKGPVITVSSGAKLTLCDCQSNVSRNRYTVDDTGLYIINNGNTGIGTLIAGGIITGGKLTERGGGIYVDSNATFVMEGGTIAGNTASNYGGGVYLNYNSTFNMNGGTIVGNTVNDENSSNVGTRGGGVCAIGARNGVFTMSGNAAISNNTAISKDESKSYGGGVFFDGPIFEMSGNAKISGNVASCGGSIDVVDFFMSDNAQISDNMATDRGGVNCANFTMNGGTISGNTATEAGVNVYGDTFIMNGGEISGNTATDGYSVWVWCDNFTINGGYFGEGEKIYYIPNNGTVNIYGGYFANQDTITDNSWLVNATVQPISSIADDVNYKEGYGYAVYHMHETEGEGDDIIFKPLPYDLSSWDGSLSGGNYYLPYDVTLTNNITIDSDVTLCLNGHILRGNGNGSVVRINSGTFTLCDCSVEQTGTITGASNPSGNDYAWQGSGGAIMNHGTFTMYGGNLSGNTADMGGGIFTRGPVYIYGGTISGNTATTNGGGIYINTGATVTLDGGEISNNNATTRGDGVYVGNGTFTMKSGTLTENAEQGVNVNGDNSSKFYMTGGYFGSNSIIVVGTEANATVQISGGYFETSPSTDFVVSGYTAISDTSVSGYNYQVVAESAAPGRVEYNGTTSYYGTINAAFNYANEVSTSSARAIITLQNNVTTSTTLEIESGKYITLDLNGYILRMTGSGSVITVNNGANFTLCDCKDGDTSIENTIETDYVSHTYNSGVITGGTGTNDGYTYGGGVYVGSNGTFEMSGGTIAGNSATGDGGGVYVKGTFTMENGTIAYNAAGGGFCGGGVYVGGTFTMENGTISGNTAGIGGGVYVYDTFTMNGGTVSDNAAGNGDGVYVSGDFTMNGGEISGNEGHGVFVYNESTFNMKGGYFGNNTIEVFTISGLSDYDGHVYITGGYFASDPASYASADYINSLTHTVVKLADDNHYGDEDYVQGYPYAVYKLVAIGNAVYHTNGTNRDYNRQPLVCDENGDFYITATYADESEVPHGLIAISYKLVGGMGDYTTTAPTNAGTYYIGVNISAVADGTNKVYYAGAQIVDDNYFTFTINKIQVAVPVAASGLEYTGGLLTGVAVAEDMDGIYTVTGGSATNVGNHTATVGLVDTINYEWADPEFDGTVSWSIAKRALTADMFQVTGSYTYTGAEREATYTFADRGGSLAAADFEVSYSNNVNAGNSAVITFTAAANGNYSGSVSLNFSIAKADYDMSGISFGNATYTYDGTEKTLVITGELPSGVIVSYTTNTLTNAGSLEVTASFTGDTANYNAIADMTATLTINKATYNMSGISFENATYTYDGNEKTLVISGTLPSGVTVTYTTNTLTNAGSIEVTASFTGDADNYNAIADMTATLTIEKATYDMSGIKFEDVTYTYDGSEKTLVITGNLPDGVTVSYTTNTLTNAGSVEVTASFMGDTDNYNAIADMTATITVDKATYDISGVKFEDATYTYDGEDKTLTISGTLPDGVTVSYTTNTLTNAGSIEVTAMFTGDANNYNTIAPMTATLTIEKATPEYTMPDGLTAVTGQTLDEIELPDGWSWQDGTLSVGEAGENTFTAVYTPVDTDNYNVVTVEINVTVEQATDNTIHYIIWGCIAGIAVVGAVIGWIIVVCVKKRRAKNGE